MEFFIYELPNGIRCILKQVKSPVVYTALSINAGSRDEGPPEHGIAHFTEHMLFKGTERRRAFHINNRLEKLGGELNAFTTKEETVVHATTLKTDLSKAADLIADVIFRSIYPENELIREREVVIDEINSYKDSPAEMIYDEFEDLVFSGSPLGHNILGTKKTVSRFTAQSIRRFVDRCYTTDQMVFSVCGNVSERSFTALADKHFGLIPPSKRDYARDLPSPSERFDRSVNRKCFQTHCILGNRAYGHKEKGRIPLALFTNIIGGPAANSILNTILREKNGLTYNIEAAYQPYADTGIATIYFGTDHDKAERCLQLIDGVLTGLKANKLTGLQLSAAKKQFIGQLAIGMENREGYILGAAKSLLTFGAVDGQKDLYSRIESVTAEDILSVANEIYTDASVLLYR